MLVKVVVLAWVHGYFCVIVGLSVGICVRGSACERVLVRECLCLYTFLSAYGSVAASVSASALVRVVGGAECACTHLKTLFLSIAERELCRRFSPNFPLAVVHHALQARVHKM